MQDSEKGNAIADRDKYLLEVWQEAWRQYSHEDNLWQQRDRFYIGIETALLTGFAFVNWWYLRLDFTAAAGSVFPSWLIYGLFVILLTSGGFAIAYVWKKGTEASRVMAHLRWLTALRIERDWSLEDRGLAFLEWKRRRHSEDNQTAKSNYVPYPDDELLCKEKVYPLQGIRGYGATLKLIGWIQLTWAAGLVICGFAIGFSVCGWC